MYRLEDNYHWKTLRHWRTALEAGKVHVRIVEEEKVTEAVLNKALKLLKNDCFPIAIICWQDERNQKEIWLSSLWTGIFDFLDGRRCLERAGEKIYFGDMAYEDKDAILNAQIAAVWVAGNRNINDDFPNG